MPTTRLVTNLFPTRYEAEANPGAICIFKPDPDGGWFHCVRDPSQRRTDSYLFFWRSEAAIWTSGEFKPSAQVFQDHRGVWVLFYWTESRPTIYPPPHDKLLVSAKEAFEVRDVETGIQQIEAWVERLDAGAEPKEAAAALRALHETKGGKS